MSSIFKTNNVAEAGVRKSGFARLLKAIVLTSALASSSAWAGTIYSTVAASNITATSATLNGSAISTVGLGGEFFYWGTTTAYGNNGAGSNQGVNGPSSLNITGLTCGTTYHYKFNGVPFGTTIQGSDMTFTTLACPVSNAYFAYQVSYNTGLVSRYNRNATTGLLTFVDSVASGGANPDAIAVHPSGKFIYVTNPGTWNVTAFSVDPTTGALTNIGTTAPIGSSAGYAAVSPNGNFLYVVGQLPNSGTIATFAIDPTTGALTLVNQAPSGSVPYKITVSPNGKFAYESDVGGSVREYTLDAVTGIPTLAGSITSVVAPTATVVDPTGKFAYVTNYTPSQTTAFNIDQVTGLLTQIGTPVADGANIAYTAAATPNGKFLYVGTQAGTVDAFSTDAVTGALTFIGSVANAYGPISIAVDDASQFVYLTSYNSADPAVYSINQVTGALTEISPSTVGGNATFGLALVTTTLPGAAPAAAAQSITFGTAPSMTFGGATASVSATASSGLTVAFTSTTTSVCSVAGSTVTALAAGTCTIAANQAGNASFLAAPQVTQNISVAKANQSVSFSTAPALTFGGTAVVNATATSGLAVAYSSTTPTVCSVTGSTVTALAVGTCTIAANQAGNGNYNAATQATQNITVSKASQSITFAAAPALVFGGTATVSAAATSGLAVTFSTSTPAVCSVSGSTVTSLAAGTCFIAANQAGDTNYAAAAQVTQTIVATISVDLRISALSTTATSVAAGASFSITDTETNSGTTPTTASNNVVNYYLSSDAVITANDTLIGQRVVGSLAAGAGSTGTTVVTVPATLAPGTYYIGAIADATNAQAETNETNNTLAGATITVVRAVDLVETSVTTTATTVAAGDSFTITDTEANIGTTATTAINHVVRYYLSTDAAITFRDTLIGERVVGLLAAGASSTASTVVTIPPTLAPGTYYIGAIADDGKVQAESNETNNALAGATIVVTRLVDLVETSVTTTATTVARGASFTITDTETNAGTNNMTATGNAVYFYLSKDAVITAGDTLIGQRLVSGSLAAGASSTASTVVTVPSTLAPGTYYIGAIADGTASQPETNELNNSLAGATITVQ